MGFDLCVCSMNFVFSLLVCEYVCLLKLNYHYFISLIFSAAGLKIVFVCVAPICALIYILQLIAVSAFLSPTLRGREGGMQGGAACVLSAWRELP